MAEQIVIEFIADNTQLLPTVEILNKIGNLSDEDLASFKKFATEGAKSLDAVTTSGKKLIPTLSDIDDKAVLLSDTFKDTFQKQVQDAFVKSGTTLQDFIKKLSAVGNQTPLNNLKVQLAGVLSQITDTASKLDTLKLTPGGADSTEVKNLENEFVGLFGTAQKLTDQIGQLEKAEDTAGKTQTSFRTQIRASTEALAQQLATGEATVAQIYAQAKGAGALKDAYGDAARAIQVLSSDTFALDATLQGVQAVAAGFQLAQGAEALFGSQNKDLQELLVKLNAIMAITTGLQQLSILLHKEEALSLAAKVLQEKLGNAEQIIENGLNSKSIIIRGAATIAQKLLNAAMAANPIGLLVTILATLVGLFATYKLTLGKTTDEEKRHAAAVEAMNEAHEKAAQAIADEVGDLNIMLAKAKDVNASYSERQATIDKIRASYPEYLNNISLENIYTTDLTTAIGKQIELLKQRALVQATEEVYKDRLKKIIDAQNDLNKTINTGATYWEKVVTGVTNFGARMTGTSAQQAVVNNKMKDLNDLTVDADEAFKNFTNTVSDGSQQSLLALNQYINKFTLFTDKLKSFPSTLPGQPTQFDPQAADDEKQQALAVSQYRVDISKKGSAEEFAARKSNADLEYQYEIKAAGTNQTKLTLATLKYNTDIHQINLDAAAANQQLSQEQFQIEERHLQQLADLYKGFVDNEKNPYDLRLGFQKQYISASLALLKKQEQDELSDANLTNAARKNIIDKYNVDSQKIISDGYKQRNDLIAAANVQLKEQDAASYQTLLDNEQKQIQKYFDTIDKQFASIGKNNTTEKSDRLTQLENDYKAGVITVTQFEQKRQALEDEFAQRGLDNEKTSIEAKLSILKFLYDNQLIDQQAYNDASAKLQSDLVDVNKQLDDSDLAHKKALEQQKLELTKNRIQQEQELFQQSLQFIQTGLQSLGDNFSSSVSAAVLNVFSVMTSAAAELQKKLLDINNDASLTDTQKQIAAAGAEAESTAQKIGAAFSATQAIINAGFQQAAQVRQQQLDIELKKLEDRKNAELTNTELTESQRAAIEKKYEQQAAQLKSQAAKKQRQADISQAVVNGFLAAGNALATVKPFIPAALIAAALAVSMAAFQVASIRSAPLPQFKKGTRNAPKGYAWVGEDGPEIIYLKGGEKIYTHTESKTIEKQWELKDQVIHSPYEALAAIIPTPVDKEIIERSYKEKTDAADIDYDKLGEFVAKHMRGVVKDIPQTSYEFDGEDIRKVIKQGNQKDILLNKKSKNTKK